MRKPSAVLIGVVVIVYFGVAVTPVKAWIGRSYPALAAAFSPPWFNFHTEYVTGDVLDFAVGMNREEFEKALMRYSGTASLIATCGGRGKSATVQLDNGSEALALMQRDRVCFWSDTRRLSLIFYFKGDVVDRIDMSLVNFEVV